MKKITLYLVACLLLSSLSTFAQDPQIIPLYTGAVPNSKVAPADYIEPELAKVTNMTNKVTAPGMYPFYPEKGKANGTSVIICPGGGYQNLAIRSEGFAVAQEFAKIGYCLCIKIPPSK